MGRKKIPDSERKKERRLYLTDAEWERMQACMDGLPDPALQSVFTMMPEWIKCSERLPEKEGAYLLYWPGETMYRIWWFNGAKFAELLNPDNAWWFPLPDPPKEGE